MPRGPGNPGSVPVCWRHKGNPGNTAAASEHFCVPHRTSGIRAEAEDMTGNGEGLRPGD